LPNSNATFQQKDANLVDNGGALAAALAGGAPWLWCPHKHRWLVGRERRTIPLTDMGSFSTPLGSLSGEVDIADAAACWHVLNNLNAI